MRTSPDPGPSAQTLAAKAVPGLVNRIKLTEWAT